MKIALGVEYDGSRFLGWQTQPGGGTVQDALQAALASIAGAPVDVVCAGRTDRGVHAREQVVHFDTPAQRPVGAWVRGVNAVLPGSIAVLWAKPVPEGFHARYSATARTYRYVLVNRPVRPALAARYTGWFHLPLDVAVTARRLDIERSGERIDFVLTANAFLHHMVRNLVGSLVYVGKGKHPPSWVGEVLESRERARAAPTFAAEGLYLEAIEYASAWGLDAGRAARTALPLER